ncbi:ferredoxin [Rhodospirillum rubrum]|uniref:2Fe-2S iron-sulfur cluster-binding protein n=1 Tax=Rhodospirillum rubrum TaxID=1085 RepID=UPI0019040962|nr:2Fe-2S iron-sulfur cluster-binding protein [Rhodospirillum rubrum]MBK1663660.1 ferredoxin [Rhodospirillum rubrum]MBK1675978.1 ferredoxin [Rhodospirillum rubrum]
MATVTFSSPILAKDVTVYAVAGDMGTLLALARRNAIPLPCQCQDGECGSCLIKVTDLGDTAPKAQALTEREKTTLSLNGKLSRALLDRAEGANMAPPYRLACQFVVPDSDILVEFSGEPGVEIDLRR